MSHPVPQIVPCEGITIEITRLIVFLGLFLYVSSQDFEGSPQSNLVSINFEGIYSLSFPVETKP